jgi:hypothetical protein
MVRRSRLSLLVAVVTAGVLVAPGARADGPGLAPDDATLAALALALATAPPPEDLAAARAGEGPRIELVATVRAARLVFDEAPRLRIAYGGSPGHVAWRAERTNLPARIQPRQVYEDVVVRVTLVGSVEEVAALLEDARAAARGIRLEELAAAEVRP